MPNFALSPDGRQLAFVATSEGKRLLWVRSLATAAARPLTGTDDASSPFWSPDSQWIGFFTSGQLKKISASGGAAITLADARQNYGGTWNSDNVVVYGASTAGLQRVSAGGGTVAVVSSTNRTRGETAHRFPFFLPDGRHFLFHVSVSGPREVRVGSLDDAEMTGVLTNASRAMYPAGHLVFSRDGTLMAVPFDAETRQVTGDPFPIAERVAESGSVGYAPFSASASGVLSFARGGAEVVQLAWVDRTGKTISTLGEPGDYRDISLAPDERRLAVTLVANNQNRDVWTIDTARSTSLRMTFDPATEAGPTWSTDGNRIAFAGREGLYDKPSDGSGDARLLMKIDGPGGATDWSKDGRFIAYRNASSQTGNDVWIVPTTGDEKPLALLHSAFDEDNAAFSPDIHWIAYESDESGERQIFFLAPDASMMAVTVSTAPGYQAAGPVRLFESGIVGGGSRQYAVTKDGRRFLTIVPRQQTAPTPITVVVNWVEALKPH